MLVLHLRLYKQLTSTFVAKINKFKIKKNTNGIKINQNERKDFFF